MAHPNTQSMLKSHLLYKKTRNLSISSPFLVREGGLEPPRTECTLEPESNLVSTRTETYRKYGKMITFSEHIIRHFSYVLHLFHFCSTHIPRDVSCSLICV